ncbi:MAG: PAS domain-containing sensor histidine kinase [Cyclobacteriaceae bacterium]
MEYQTKDHQIGEGQLFNMGLFFDLSPDLLCIASFDGYFKKVNASLIKLFGYSKEELYAQPIHCFVYEADVEKTLKSRENVKNGTPLLNFENRYVTKKGEIIWLSWTSVPSKSEGFIYAIAKNITHIKRLEEDRNFLINNLTIANKELKELTYTTSHDLRAPVNNLLAIFSMLNISKIKDEEIVELINLLKLSTDGLKNTLDNYVDTLTQKEFLQVSIEKLDLKTTFLKVQDSIRSLIETSHTSIEIDFTTLPEINFNKAYLESVFLNLLSNSIKYARPGVPAHIKVFTRYHEGFKQLIFIDNGLGFNMEKVGDKVFGFKQTFHSNADSKGIGLYLIYNHITALGGKIEIESQPNQGAKFIISFKG